MFETYLSRWDLVRDGAPITTRNNDLLPVLCHDVPAMLKIARVPEETRGAKLMIWWDGDGAARVLKHEDDALLLERALGTHSLTDMARLGQDDDASRIICQVAAKLHAPRPNPPPRLTDLSTWFRQLWPAAQRSGGILARAASIASDLLADQHEIVPLHGDLHHGNVLDFERGWLAIDPKHIVGERAFDFANILRNPDFDLATAPGRLARQAHIVAEAAGIGHRRLLQWTFALAGLSAAWNLDDGHEPVLDLAIAERAERALSELA